MNSVQFAEYGDPDVLYLDDVDEPHAGPGRIRVAARPATTTTTFCVARLADEGAILPLLRRFPTLPVSL